MRKHRHYFLLVLLMFFLIGCSSSGDKAIPEEAPSVETLSEEKEPITDVDVKLPSKENGVKEESTVVRITMEKTPTQALAIVTRFEITPKRKDIPLGLSHAFTAMATFSDGSQKDVTNAPTIYWQSDDESLARVAGGEVQSVATGLTAISASYQGVETTAQINILEPAITQLAIIPKKSVIALGSSNQFSALATLTDGSNADITDKAGIVWESENRGVANVFEGRAESRFEGDTVIRVSYEAFEDTAELTVTDATMTGLNLSPSEASMSLGETVDFSATATFSNAIEGDVSGDSMTSWRSDAEKIATVKNGKVEGVGVGTATITVSSKSFSKTATVIVTDPVVTKLEVTPEKSEVALGRSTTFTVMAMFSDGSTVDVTNNPDVTWESAAEAIATVTEGTVQSVAEGETSISATYQGVDISAELIVVAAIMTKFDIDQKNEVIIVGRSQALTATAVMSDGQTVDVSDKPEVTWVSDNEGIATVDKGVVQGVAMGITTIRATYEGVRVAVDVTVMSTVTELSITPYRAQFPVGVYQDLMATAIFSDGSQRDVTADVSWASSNKLVVMVTGDKAKALSVGETIMTASYQDMTTTANFKVSEAIDVTKLEVFPKKISVVRGGSFNLSAIATLSDGSSYRVTPEFWVDWSSSDVKHVQVDKGKVTGTRLGTSKITASFRINAQTFTDDADITVLQASSVVAWGEGFADVSDDTKAQLVDAVSISTRYGEAYAALKNDGTVVTWGQDYSGGDSSAVQDELFDIVSIVHGSDEFAALKSDGTVVAWGGGQEGGSTDYVDGELHDVVALSSGGYALAAVKADGSVVAWGEYSHSQIDEVKGQLVDVVSIVGNGYDVFAALRKDRRAIIWGSNNDNWGNEKNVIKAQFSDVVSIIGGENAFAMIKQDGRAEAWGDSYHGGNSSGVQSALVNVSSITAGGFAFAALRKDGSVVTWGDQDYGGNSADVQKDLVDVISIAATRSLFAALKKDGSVVTWGGGQTGKNMGHKGQTLFQSSQTVMRLQVLSRMALS